MREQDVHTTGDAKNLRARRPRWTHGVGCAALALVCVMAGCGDDGGESSSSNEGTSTNNAATSTNSGSTGTNNTATTPDASEDVQDTEDASEDDVSADVAEDVEPDAPDWPCEVAWVPIKPNTTQGVEIFAYEASRLDATDAVQGSDISIACSQPGVQPWTDVNYNQAIQACASVGGRLCTGAEWDDACTGPGGAQPYPYGDRYDPDACNVLESPNGCLTGSCSTAPTGAYERCRSPIEVFDLSGNVSEWVVDQRPFGEEAFDVRGGSYQSANDNTIRCRNAQLSMPRESSMPTLGFRCCRQGR